MAGPSPEPIGLIAGAGRLPVLSAEGIVAAGHPLIVAGLRGFVRPELIDLASAYRPVGVAQLGRIIRHLKKHRCRQAVMIGSVRKAEMYSRWRWLRYLPDLRTIRLWYHTIRHDRRDNAVLLAVAGELRREGIELMSSVQYCSDHLSTEGVMTRTSPPRAVQADIEFGWRIAVDSARLDIGQSIAVRDKDIIAVEAIEGTDAMIARAGELCPTAGWTLVKVARPDQDMRFDVPTVGPDTIRHLHQAGCACLVLEAGRTLIADKPASLALADELGLAVVGHAPPADAAARSAR